MPRHLLACMLCLHFSPTHLAAVEPSPEAVQSLLYMNRLRANPQVDTERILQWEDLGVPGMRDPDLQLFRKEMSSIKATPPLVFTTRLCAAADAHAAYLSDNRLTTRKVNGHHEDPKLPGFTGKLPADRCRKAGYKGYCLGENVARHATGVWTIHQSLVIDWGPGPGGMQPGRGHRMAMVNPQAREVGIGWRSRQSDRHVIVQKFGLRPRQARAIGGVVFKDVNGNGRYDLDEGIAGASIKASGGEQSTSWQSGAYTLHLKANQATELRFSLPEGQDDSWQTTSPAGQHNQQIVWMIPADKTKSLVTSLAKQANLNATEQINLAYIHLIGAATLPPDLLTKIADRKKTLAKDCEAMRQAVRKGDSRTAKSLLTRMKKTYAKTDALVWFEEATLLLPVHDGMVELMQAARTGARLPTTRKSSLSGKARSLRRKVTQAEWLSMLDIIEQHLSLLVAAR